MNSILYIFASTVDLALFVIETLMFIRAIISWFPVSEDSKIVSFLYMTTEPIITPVRMLLDHFGWFEDMPIDMSFLITFILISIIRFII